MSFGKPIYLKGIELDKTIILEITIQYSVAKIMMLTRWPSGGVIQNKPQIYNLKIPEQKRTFSNLRERYFECPPKEYKAALKAYNNKYLQLSKGKNNNELPISSKALLKKIKDFNKSKNSSES